MSSISVVVPTHQRRDRLERTLDSLAVQTIGSDFEVVVVADGCTDGTGAFLAESEWPFRLVAIEQENRGAGGARNAGIEAATGELVVFLDDDIVASADLLERHRDGHIDQSSLALIGPMATPTDANLSFWVQWEQDMLEKQYRAMEAGHYGATTRQFYTGNASVRRIWLAASGGFDETLRRDEDTELAHRLEKLGVTFDFDPEAIGWHYASRSFESWQSTAAAYGATTIQFDRDRGRDPGFARFSRFYHRRNLLVRWLVRLTLGRKRLQAATLVALRKLAQFADRRGWSSVVSYACSGMQNIVYYEAAAAELGGRRALYRTVRQVWGPWWRGVPRRVLRRG